MLNDSPLPPPLPFAAPAARRIRSNLLVTPLAIWRR